MMDKVLSEIRKTNKFVVKWLSFIIMQNATNIENSAFRILDCVLFKVMKLKNHQMFTETCINIYNDL